MRRNLLIRSSVVAIGIFAVISGCSWFESAVDSEVESFLETYDDAYREVSTRLSEAQWLSVTDVNDAHSAAAIAAGLAYAEFVGKKETIESARALRERPTVNATQRMRLDRVLLNAASFPGTIPDVVRKRVEAEEKQSAAMNSFQFEMVAADGAKSVVTPNKIDEILGESTDLGERLRAWEASKSIGAPLRAGLVELRDLRNQVAREMGHPGFFSLQVADYGMTSDEMMALLDRILADIEPLFSQLHAYAKNQLANRYSQAVPRRIPAHWIANRWAQEWPGIVAGIDLDPLFAGMTPQQVVDHAQAFYTSMGFPELPASFHEKSDLWELPAGATRKKNTHASAWHIDLDQDVRSLMSVRPDFNWFTTTHHELGHIHYYLAYSRPEVSYLLRDGANRAFHEGIGELISLAASQQSYLRDVGVAKESIDPIRWLLNDAMTSVPLLAWAAGTMSHFEHDLYDGDLPAEELNERWWQYVQWYQGVDPPSPRRDADGYCDAATKTHINDDPAQYYDYALATVIKFQLHEHIATKILKQDVRDANYRGSEAAGEFLRGILAVGRTRDWRELLREATGEDLSARAMLAYYQPLLDWLKQQNAKADLTFRD